MYYVRPSEPVYCKDTVEQVKRERPLGASANGLPNGEIWSKVWAAVWPMSVLYRRVALSNCPSCGCHAGSGGAGVSNLQVTLMLPYDVVVLGMQ